MKVEKISLDTRDTLLVIDDPIKQYYRLKLKSKSKCPACKKGKLSFAEKNRFLIMACDTASCKNNMKIPIDTYYSYNKLYETNQEQYMNSVTNIIQKKYDILFKYTSDQDISDLRTSYLKNKETYDTMNQHYYETDTLRMEELKKLYTERDELLNQKIIPPELNDTLNQIHTHEYKQIGNAYELYTPFNELIQMK